MHKNHHESGQYSLSYTATAAIMGLSFAMALGSTAYAGGPIVKRGSSEEQNRAALQEALEDNDFHGYRRVVQQVYPGAVVTQSFFRHAQEQYTTQVAYHAALEEVLRDGSYELWLNHMAADQRIQQSVDRGDMMFVSTGGVAAHSCVHEDDCDGVHDEFGLPIGKSWYGDTGLQA